MFVNSWGTVQTWTASGGTGPGVGNEINYIGSGWPHACGIELFTLGWIGCGGGTPAIEFKPFWTMHTNNLLGDFVD